jgi:nitric oxide reductase subunit B
MIALDTFPAGVLQFKSVVENGYWFARSQEFILGGTFQMLTWMRMVGGAVFFVGGVIPLLYFMITRLNSLKAATPGHVSEYQVRTEEPLPESNVQTA